MATFVDRVLVHVRAGDGGNGCTSVHREKFKPLGGPDGGDGGRGGDVELVVDGSTPSLLELHRSPHRTAGKGRPGEGSNRTGADGADVVIAVPDGTVVSTPDGQILADLVGLGARHVIAHGGRGGLGNARLASQRRKAPGFALLGEPGDCADVVLELKTVADAGLIGFPSAGKSSLISVLSAARPQIADYPFTTLTPHLGVVEAGETVFTVADVPGLIPGASQGRGLGLEFLRHIERCAVLVHVLDCGTLDPGRDPITDLEVIEAELTAYGGLRERPRVVALNKCDLPEAAELAKLVAPELEDRGYPVFPVAAVSHQGLRELKFALAAFVRDARAEQVAAAQEAPRIVLSPSPVDDSRFTVTHEGDIYRVTGSRPQRWVRQTDFGNDEAVGYLADRLARLGVEDELARLGAEPGATVAIGVGDDAVVFDWEPAIVAGQGHPQGRRGQDPRLER